MHIITTTTQFASSAGSVDIDLSSVIPNGVHAFVIGASVQNKTNSSYYQVSTGNTLGSSAEAFVSIIDRKLRSYITSSTLNAFGGKTVNVTIAYVE